MSSGRVNAYGGSRVEGSSSRWSAAGPVDRCGASLSSVRPSPQNRGRGQWPGYSTGKLRTAPRKARRGGLSPFANLGHAGHDFRNLCFESHLCRIYDDSSLRDLERSELTFGVGGIPGRQPTLLF